MGEEEIWRIGRELILREFQLKKRWRDLEGFWSRRKHCFWRDFELKKRFWRDLEDFVEIFLQELFLS
jgi:hypothetical protein